MVKYFLFKSTKKCAGLVFLFLFVGSGSGSCPTWTGSVKTGSTCMKVDDSMLHHVLQVAEPVVEVLQVNSRPPPGTLPVHIHHNAKNRAE
jgi:hypothetical protein